MGKKYLPGMLLGPNQLLLKERTKRVGNNYYGIFVCFCGKEFETRISGVVNGNCKSCGCLNTLSRKQIGHNNKKDLTNQRFGKLIALYPTEKRSQRKIKWYCKCDCGNFILVSSSDLINGHTKSCGCLHSGGELQIQNILSKNKIYFEKEKIFINCKNPQTNSYLRFDFYLPKYNCCIECNGMQHYKPVEFWGGEEKYNQRLYLDKIKKEYCDQNNIKLIIIPYKNNGDIKEQDILNYLNEV